MRLYTVMAALEAAIQLPSRLARARWTVTASSHVKSAMSAISPKTRRWCVRT